MRLYICEHCPFCARARVIFGLKSLPVELVVLMERDEATPTRLIGKKAVPILQRADGTHMCESLDIVRYVDDLGEPVLRPGQTPALEVWRSSVIDNAAKLFIPRFVEGDFAELKELGTREAFRRREAKTFGDLDALRVRTPELLDIINAQLLELSPLVDGRMDYDISDIVVWPILRSLSIVAGVQFPNPVMS